MSDRGINTKLLSVNISLDIQAGSLVLLARPDVEENEDVVDMNGINSVWPTLNTPRLYLLNSDFT